MNTEEVAVALKGHEHEIGSLKHRMEEANKNHSRAYERLYDRISKKITSNRRRNHA